MTRHYTCPDCGREWRAQGLDPGTPPGLATVNRQCPECRCTFMAHLLQLAAEVVKGDDDDDEVD